MSSSKTPIRNGHSSSPSPWSRSSSTRALSKSSVFQTTASDYLRQEADRLKAKLQNAEQAVQKFREDHNAVSLEDKQNIIVEKLKELNLKVTEAKSERLKLEADVATIKQGKAKTPDELLMLPSVAALPVVAALRQELADRESKFKAESQLKGLQQSLNRTLINVANMVIKSYEAAKSTEGQAYRPHFRSRSKRRWSSTRSQSLTMLWFVKLRPTVRFTSPF